MSACHICSRIRRRKARQQVCERIARATPACVDSPTFPLMMHRNDPARREARRLGHQTIPRGRVPSKTGAEGATTPETLRHKGPRGEMNFWKAGRPRAAVLTEGVSRFPAKSLRSHDRGVRVPVRRHSRASTLLSGPPWPIHHQILATIRFAARRFTRFIWSWAERWCRSPAMRCRYNIPRAC